MSNFEQTSLYRRILIIRLNQTLGSLITNGQMMRMTHATGMKGDTQVMADTGENRQIAVRANAKEAETVRSSKRMMSEEQSAEKATDDSFAVKQYSGRNESRQKHRVTKASKR